MPRLRQLVREVHQRSLWQAVVVYLGASLGVLGTVDLFIEYLGLPRWLIWVAFSLLVTGLPVVVVISLAKEEVYGDEVPAEHAEAAAEEDRRLRFLTWRTAGLAFVGALAVWGVVLTGWVVLYPRARASEAFADAAPAIAVLPFSVHGEGLDVWREGMVNLLSTDMNGVGGLRTIDSRTLLARWDERVPETGEADRATALGVAQATGARYALLGSAVAVGRELRLAADIYDTEGGTQLGSVQVEGSPDSVLGLVDRLAIQSLGVVLGQEASELPLVDLAGVTTASIQALTAWLEGEALFRRGDFEAAIPAYERAVAADSTFALAYYGLADAIGWLESANSDRARAAWDQAVRWVDRLPAREADLVRAVHAWVQYELAEAEEILQRLVRTYPDYALAWYVLGDMYGNRGRFIPVSAEDVQRCIRRAVELDPRFAPYRILLNMFAFKFDPDSAEVARLIEEYKPHANPDALTSLRQQLAFDLTFGDREHRERALESIGTLDAHVGWYIPAMYLTHPRFWPQWEAMGLSTDRRMSRQALGSFTSPWVYIRTSFQFSGAAMGRGYLGKGLDYIDDPRATTYDRGCLPVHAYIDGFPVPADRLEEAAALLSQIDSASDPRLVYCAGFLAATQGRWADHARAVELAWDVWRREVDAGRLSWIAKADALAVEAYGLWRRGDPEAALAKLEEVRRYQVTDHVRRVLGQVLMDLERWEEAVPYLHPNWLRPHSHEHYQLARAYEGMVENEKAAKEYAFFLEAWEDADPELQPWVEDARRALARLVPDR